MKYLDLIKQLDFKPNKVRLEIIIKWMEDNEIVFRKHKYSTGTNLIVDLGDASKKIGISSHFDRVPDSGGANDNGSAIAVCLEIIRKFKEYQNNDLGIRVFFFDQEETGLLGSIAYVKEFGVDDLVGLMNMELVGSGDKFALWPVHEISNGQILKTFEVIAQNSKIDAIRFDQIVTNTADHLPFQMNLFRTYYLMPRFLRIIISQLTLMRKLTKKPY